MRKSAPSVFAPLTGQTRTPLLTATRTLGALALLVVGGVHYQQYHYNFYSAIPTIGPLFLANFISATALGLFLLAPAKARWARRGEVLDRLAALGGVGVATGGLVALLISEHTPLFGFMEHGYRFAIVLAIASDVAAIALLGLFLVRARSASRARTQAKRERPSAPSAGDPTGQPSVAVR